MHPLENSIGIRPIRPDDVERLQAFHRTLSPVVIHLRFHGMLRELPSNLARSFCTVDGRDRVAFVAVASVPEQIVGVGRYDRVDPTTAEIAFVVTDAYHHMGIGTRLLERLIHSARRHDIGQLLAWVLPGNNEMRKLLLKTDLPLVVERGMDADAMFLQIGGRV